MRVLGLSLVLILGLACAEPAPAPPDQSYTLNGEIYQLPEAGSNEIYVRHEAIPHFVSSEGQVVGMEAMTMPFAMDPSLSLEGMEPETPITFNFEVRWNGSPPFLITSWEKRDVEELGTEGSTEEVALELQPEEPEGGEEEEKEDGSEAAHHDMH